VTCTENQDKRWDRAFGGTLSQASVPLGDSAPGGCQQGWRTPEQTEESHQCSGWRRAEGVTAPFTRFLSVV